MKEKIISPRIFTTGNVETPKHDEFLLLYSEDSELLKKIIRDELYLIENSVIRQLTSVKAERIFSFDKQIVNWEPEKAIMRERGGYIGSLDLYVAVRLASLIKIVTPDTHTEAYECDGTIYKEPHWSHVFCKTGSCHQDHFEFIFEFKPKITSFSEVLRQVNVYKEYFPSAVFYVITYSDIDKYKAIFESQNIKIIQLKNPETL